MPRPTTEYTIIVRDGTEYEVRLNDAGEILCDLCDDPTENAHGVCDACLPSACANLGRAVASCLAAIERAAPTPEAPE